MTHTLNMTDGTTTISLVSSNIVLLQYVPQTPEIAVTHRDTLNDGMPVDSPRYENVVETIEILFDNSSKTSLQGQINAINRMLGDAHTRQRTKAGDKIYLQLQVDGDSDTYRSEIFTGRLELDQDALRHYANIKVQAALIIERAYFWEGPQTELELSNGSQGAATGGCTIYNHDDGDSGHDNYVQIAADQVEGDLPTPAKLTLQNTSGSSQSYWHFHIATNAYSDPDGFTHIIEGEDADTGGSTVVDATSSGGNMRRFSLGTTAGQWTIAGSQLQKTAGRFFRLLVRFDDVVGDGYIKPEIRDSAGLLTLWEGDEVFVTSDVAIADLGTVPLPPGTGGISWDDMRLYLGMRTDSSGTLDLDFIQLTPTDSYAYITQLGYPIADDDFVTVDGIEGVVHSDGLPIYTSSQPTVWLFPNRQQRLIFLHNETTIAPDISNTMSVRAYVRPRRLTI